MDHVVERPLQRLYAASTRIDHASGTVVTPGVHWVPSGVVHAAEVDADRTLCGYLVTRLYPFRGRNFRQLLEGRSCVTCAEKAGLG